MEFHFSDKGENHEMKKAFRLEQNVVGCESSSEELIVVRGSKMDVYPGNCY